MIQAIPTYLMGIYKFPASVTNAISSAMAQFFWGQADGKRRIHWKSWKAMCELKCLGGLGFKDLEIFNDALLGRQAWRLMKGENTLLGKVMKAKYYRHCSFLEAPLGYSPSYSWRGVWSAKALVREGMIWRVGDGRKINIWREPWIADHSGRFIQSEEVEEVSKVSELMQPGVMEWDLELLARIFNERDQKCILSIPLSERCPQDMITWAFTKSGEYSVKSAYMLGKGFELDNFHNAWVTIWNIAASPKVRFFLWRLCTGTLPTKALLQYRHLMEEAHCPWCSEVETDMHAIFGCPRVTELWEESGSTQLIQNAGNTAAAEFVASWKTLEKKIQQKLAILAWCIWTERNEKVFNNTTTPNSVLLARLQRLITEHDKYSTRIYGARRGGVSASAKKWQAPEVGHVKLNCDASMAVEGWIGLGVVARDSEGRVLFAATRRVRATWPVEIAEGKALLMALRLADRFGLRHVTLESDSQVLITRLSKAMTYSSDLDSVLDDILAKSCNFLSVVWSHVKRDGNAVAHHLAKLVPFGVEQIWENHCPWEVQPYVLMDTLSLD